MYRVVRHAGPRALLDRAEPWLLEREDHHNLVLSLAYSRAEGGEASGDGFFASVEDARGVVGVVLRTPPHKVLVTELPVDAGPAVASALAEVYADLPCVLGPEAAAEAVAMAWCATKDVGWHPGMEQMIYRLDRVRAPVGVPGTMRRATTADLDLATEWGEGFARDAGTQFATARETIGRWIERGALYVWQVDEPVSIAVAHGRTPHGIRVGYVYTPPAHRRQGYASACVAALSQEMLDGGVDFCVLYTDRSNPTSNAIYQRLGYSPIADVRDFDIVGDGS